MRQGSLGKRLARKRLGKKKAWCDGYQFATSKGKPIAAAAAKTEMKQDSPDFAAIARRCGLRPVHRDT